MNQRRTPDMALIGLLLLAGCGGRSSNYRCGMAAMAGLSMVLEQFNRPGSTLGAAPAQLPESLPVRLALGPALRAVAGRGDSGVVIGVEGTIPPSHEVGFGVLVLDPSGHLAGVILFEGAPVQGAPKLGMVNLGSRNVPLIGIQLDLQRFQNAACPIFPDSV